MLLLAFLLFLVILGINNTDNINNSNNSGYLILTVTAAGLAASAAQRRR